MEGWFPTSAVIEAFRSAVFLATEGLKVVRLSTMETSVARAHHRRLATAGSIGRTRTTRRGLPDQISISNPLRATVITT